MTALEAPFIPATVACFSINMVFLVNKDIPITLRTAFVGKSSSHAEPPIRLLTLSLCSAQPTHRVRPNEHRR
ncbi:MAG TPA: hypothetical protein VMW37_04085 [Dehalococcoidales bacterium]|nr:hypothetical protein [Dehalococcoidales bacterium]